MLKKAAGALGALFLLIGIAGFIPGLTEPIVGSDHELLLGLFEVNPVHNIVHILSGLLGLAMAGTVRLARMYMQIVAVAYGAVLIIGLLQGDTVLGLFPVNAADHWLHAAITLYAVYFGFVYRQDTANA